MKPSRTLVTRRATALAAALAALAALIPATWLAHRHGEGLAQAATTAAITSATSTTASVKATTMPAAPHAPANTNPLVSTRSPQVIQGAYLARLGDCVACHTMRGGAPFAGGLAMPTPFGTMYTPNITSDPQYGIGTWTSEDFYRALHNGIGKHGELLYPGFPFASYTQVSRADADAIFAYLRTVPPVHIPSKPHQLKFPFDHREMLLGWRALYFKSGQFAPDPGKSVEWNRGAYLVDGLGHCSMCHTSISSLGGPVNSAAFAGGLIPMQNWYAPSLTNNAEHGLGTWSTADIGALLQAGVSNKGAVFGPMADVVHNSLQYMTDADAQAMATYLKSIPQKHEAPTHLQYETSEQLGRQLLGRGRKLYADNCATCHGAAGLGKPPAYPPLALNHSITMESAVNPIRMVLNGGYPPSTFKNPRPYGMPPFAQKLSNDEVAAVVTYIRMSWGNQGTPIAPQQVSDLRSTPLD